MRYRRITTTGQIREKKKERRQSIYVWLIVIVILAILVGVGYLATPSTVLLQQTAFRGISYRPLMAFVMLFTAIFIIVIGILLADKYTKVGYYLKTIAFGIVIGMLFHGMGVNLLLNMNHWLASRTPVRKEYRVTEIRFLKALITTVINNPEFQELHGFKLKKKEKEITLGLYKDDRGEFLYQERDEWGDVIEPIDEYISRVAANSSEYIKIMQIADWIEQETQGLIFTKDVSAAYDDKTLEFEIRKAHLTQGIDYFFYDTFKNDIATTGDWAAMKITATKMTEIAKQLDMFGYLSIQLTDDANFVKPDELTSSNIANCKSIKHVLYTLFL